MSSTNVDKKSGSFRVYKSLGAAQFRVLPPRYNAAGYIDKNGAILVEVAPGNKDRNNPQWDWDKKISFAISIEDLTFLFDGVNPKARRLFHDHNNTPKTLEFVPGTGDYEGTYMLNVSSGKGDSRQTVMVPFTNGEYNVTMGLLSRTAPLLIGWDNA